MLTLKTGEVKYVMETIVTIAFVVVAGIAIIGNLIKM